MRKLLLQDPPLCRRLAKPVSSVTLLVRYEPRASASSRPIRKKRRVGAISVAATDKSSPARRQVNSAESRWNKGLP
jgi:hypothetical protein